MAKNSAYDDATKEFDKLLLKAIDDAFDSLGVQSKEAIYAYLRDLGISKKTITRDIDAFSEALYDLFGSAAGLLEILIIQNLHRKDASTLYWKEPSWLIPELTLSKFVVNKRRLYKKQANVKFQILLNLEEIKRQNR